MIPQITRKEAPPRGVSTREFCKRRGVSVSCRGIEHNYDSVTSSLILQVELTEARDPRLARQLQCMWGHWEVVRDGARCRGPGWGTEGWLARPGFGWAALVGEGVSAVRGLRLRAQMAMERVFGLVLGDE